MLSAVSLRDLALVQAVHRHGSFNSAARAMHISPSGLSHQVQKVEQALGPLFERGGRKVVPTAGGQRVLAQIDALLAGAERLDQSARAGAAAFGGELRLGMPSTLGPYLLPHLIGPFPKRFPGVRLGLSEGKPRGLLRRLHEGELDAVLTAEAKAASGIAMEPLFFEPWLPMFRDDHPRARDATVALAALDPAEATLMAESHPEVDGAHVQDVSLESLAALLLLRGGYALVPALARTRLAAVPGVSLVAVAGDVQGRRIALYWRESTPWLDDLIAFAALLRAIAAGCAALEVLDGTR